MPGPTWTNESVESTISRWETYASEEEAKNYIETGEWPLNNYVKDNVKKFIKNAKNIKEEDKEKQYNETINNFSGKNFSPFTGPV